jgi:uncharacterized membrane-anchored protein
MTDATSPSSTSHAIPGWRFWVPLVAQAIIILGVPAQALYTQMTGTTMILQVAPVDPYDILRGYYVTLGYDISLPDELKKLPGWDTLIDAEAEANGQTVEPKNGQSIYLDAGGSKPRSPHQSSR